MHHQANHPQASVAERGVMLTAYRADGITMQSHAELVGLARISWRWSRMLTTPGLVTALEQVARDYQRRAAELDGGALPDIDEHQ